MDSTIAKVADKYVYTRSGADGACEVFTGRDHALLAALVYRRMGRDIGATVVAWRRLLQNSATEDDLRLLVRAGLAWERLAHLCFNVSAYPDPDGKWEELCSEVTEV